ncbi:peptidylprolyl isomerase [Bacteriovorax sp. Seq25_V]|uniref:peptidylprolyl isomerase n=1 Tax=Bacteriovorax sp. Seq25_V TaxID=1201288 RepID=UPI00038A4DBB|nr:peptidylprolyl isomerase [Bacteriovorax sp. Seq25_V]EQC45562.1 peptidyl-prolyl cis-trans isomerase B [Bacteriovorax sp. Seq25_V]
MVKFKFFAVLLLTFQIFANTKVLMKTTKGDIELELFDTKAPITVKNFLSYVNDGFYNGTIFHRVIDNFMIQGGGFDINLKQKDTKAPIKNEATNGISNTNGTIAMARTSVVDSATAQFFINVKDNTFLDNSGTSPSQYGYAVFGKVTKGMSVVNAIKKVQTSRNGGMGDVPVQNIIINSMTVLK